MQTDHIEQENKIRKIVRDVIQETSLSRIWQHIENDGSFGVISPFRYNYSKEENMERLSNLIKKIRTAGLGYIELKGGFNENGNIVEERSLFIPNIKEDFLINLGIEFEQYSVIYKDSKKFVEIGTNKDSGIKTIKNNFIQKGWNKNLKFDSELTKEFFSELLKGSHRGRKFLFNLKESYLYEIVGLSFNEVAYGNKKYDIDNKLIKLL